MSWAGHVTIADVGSSIIGLPPKIRRRKLVRRLSVMLLVTELIGAVILGTGTAVLFHKAVRGDQVPPPRSALAQVFVSGLQEGDLVELYVRQETEIGGELSLSFTFASDGLAGREGAPLDVELVFSSARELDIRCLTNDNSQRELGDVSRGQLSMETAREVESLQWADSRSFPIGGATYLRERKAFWSRIHAYRFSTESSYIQPRTLGLPTSRQLIDRQRAETPKGLSSSFHCTVPPSTAWERSGGGEYVTFAPFEIATAPHGPWTGSFYNPISLSVETWIQRDFDFVLTQKPDATGASLAQWRFESPVMNEDTGSVAPSDYFVFEKADRASKQNQYSFWFGIFVTLFVTTVTAIFATIFRLLTGRSEYYHLADE